MLRHRSNSVEVSTLIKLLNMKLDKARHNLVTCSPETLGRLQGEAMAYEKLIKGITRPITEAVGGKNE